MYEAVVLDVKCCSQRNHSDTLYHGLNCKTDHASAENESSRLPYSVVARSSAGLVLVDLRERGSLDRRQLQPW